MPHARHAYPSETSPALQTYLLSSIPSIMEGSWMGASTLATIYRDATAPNVYRTDEESTACSIVARACRALRQDRYGKGRTVELLEDDFGTWIAWQNEPSKV
jgi:hypothetical protein